VSVPYDCIAVTTSEAKAAATRDVTGELTFIGRELAKLPDRRDQIAKLRELKASELISDGTREFLRLTGLREIQYFMDYVLSQKIEEFDGETETGHDHSKDELFFFAAAAFFDGNVRDEEMDRLREREFIRHYSTEAHHPEFEKYSDRECTNIDILEMAIDRLARNLQFGNGIVDMDVLRKYMPVFPLGNNTEKQMTFMKHAEKYRAVVQAAFHEMFPETREWNMVSEM